MWSHGTPRSRESFIRCPMPCRNSSAAVQQAQPFCSSTVSSGDDVPPVFLDTSAASMFISATSFTMRPTLIPALFSSRCFSSVVLPAPRKPESSVIGVVSGKSIFSPAPAIPCAGATAAAPRSAGGTRQGGNARKVTDGSSGTSAQGKHSSARSRQPVVRPRSARCARRGVPNVPAAADSTHASLQARNTAPALFAPQSRECARG